MASNSCVIRLIEIAVSHADGSDVNEDATASGLERIRGILRRKTSESATEMKGILRSKSPSSEGSQPKSILKRHNPEEESNGGEEVESGSSSSSEELIVPAENDLAAKLLNVELEAKNHQVTHAAETATATPSESQKATPSKPVADSQEQKPVQETAGPARPKT